MKEKTMITHTDGYIHIIEYLTAHLSLFENSSTIDNTGDSVLEVIELESILAFLNTVFVCLT